MTHRRSAVRSLVGRGWRILLLLAVLLLGAIGSRGATAIHAGGAGPGSAAIPDIFNNWNAGNVDSESTFPAGSPTFSITTPMLIFDVLDYHNSLRGTTCTTTGTIALQQSGGGTYGPWTVTCDQYGATWETYPDTVIPSGTYTVIDSGAGSSWSNDEASSGIGLSEVQGWPMPIHFAVQTSATSAAVGSEVTYTATAESSTNVALVGYAGPVDISSSDTTATLPTQASQVTWSGGVGTFSVTFNDVGDWTVTVADHNDSGITGTSEPLEARTAISISTAVDDATTNDDWSGTEETGATAYDTASLSPGNLEPTAIVPASVVEIAPTGTVTYDLFDNGSCAGDPAGTGAVTLGDGLAPRSSTTAALAAGSYSFQATYSGDDNFQNAMSSCETFAVSKAPSTTTAVVDDAATNAAWSGAEVSGATAYDMATVTGVTGFTPTGTLTYDLFDNGACSGGPAANGAVSLASGIVPNSSSTGALAAGTYSFQATYAGDASYLGSVSTCAAFTVTARSSSSSGESVVTAPTATATSSATPAPTSAATQSQSTATVTQALPSPTASTTLATSTATAQPTEPIIIYNERHTIIGAVATSCSHDLNLTWPYQPGCETVSAHWLPGAHITYTLSYADGTTQTTSDTADSAGHSLVVFIVSYQPPAGAAHGTPPTTAYITVVATSSDGMHTITAHLRFAVLHRPTA